MLCLRCDPPKFDSYLVQLRKQPLEARSIRSGSGLIVERAIFAETAGETIRGSFLRGDSQGNVSSGEAKENAGDQQASGADKSRFVDIKSQTDRVFYLGWAWTPGEASDKAAVKNPI